MNKLLIIASIFVFSLLACSKEDAGTEGFEFSSTLAPYVTVQTSDAKKAIAIKQDSSTVVTFLMRTALQEPVTATYNVSGGGLNLTNQTVTIARNQLNGTAKINIPANAIVPPSTTAKATLTLTKAVTASGRELTIGQKNIGTEAITINITQ